MSVLRQISLTSISGLRTKLSAQRVGPLEIAPSRFRVRYGDTVEINMFDFLDSWIPQSPIINNSGHDGFHTGLIVFFFEEGCGNNQGFFMMQERHSTFNFAAPALRV